MVGSKIYKGIEFVQLSDLPVDQQEKIKSTFNKELFIKILVKDKILVHCIQYTDYRGWFEKVFLPERELRLKKDASPVLSNQKTMTSTAA